MIQSGKSYPGHISRSNYFNNVRTSPRKPQAYFLKTTESTFHPLVPNFNKKIKPLDVKRLKKLQERIELSCEKSSLFIYGKIQQESEVYVFNKGHPNPTLWLVTDEKIPKDVLKSLPIKALLEIYLKCDLRANPELLQTIKIISGPAFFSLQQNQPLWKMPSLLRIILHVDFFKSKAKELINPRV